MGPPRPYLRYSKGNHRPHSSGGSTTTLTSRGCPMSSPAGPSRARRGSPCPGDAPAADRRLPLVARCGRPAHHRCGRHAAGGGGDRGVGARPRPRPAGCAQRVTRGGGTIGYWGPTAPGRAIGYGRHIHRSGKIADQPEARALLGQRFTDRAGQEAVCPVAMAAISPVMPGSVPGSRRKWADYSYFALLAAMNPCPCGYYCDPTHECTCSRGMAGNTPNRISGPMMDRIDIHIEVPPVDYEKLAGSALGESSAVVCAPALQCRHGAGRGTASAGEYSRRELDHAGRSPMMAAMQQLGLSARAHHRVLKLAHTIAGLAGSAWMGFIRSHSLAIPFSCSGFSRFHAQQVSV
jgi:hypothetical protein